MTARARNTDPSSSHDAAAHVEKTRSAKNQCRRVLSALKGHPHRTSNELAVESGLDRYIVARRLPELKQRKLVRQSSIKRNDMYSQRKAVTWWPV